MTEWPVGKLDGRLLRVTTAEITWRVVSLPLVGALNGW